MKDTRHAGGPIGVVMLFFILFMGCYVMAVKTNRAMWWLGLLALSILSTINNVMALSNGFDPLAVVFGFIGLLMIRMSYKGFRSGR